MGSFLAFFVLLLAAIAPQGQAPTSRPSPAESRPSVSAEPNPFRADESLLKLLGVGPAATASDGYAPLAELPALPDMRVKGLMKVEGRSRVAAMIEVKGVGSYTAREGDKLSFSVEVQARPRQTPGGATYTRGREAFPIVLRVDHVGSDGVVVEVGTLGKFLVIR